MRHAHALGTILIVVALVLGTALAVGLYKWEATTRAGESSFFPTATPLPAPTPTTATAPGSGATATAGAPSSGPVAQESASAASGEKLFAAKCGACHPGARAGLGPAASGPAFAAKFPNDEPLVQLIRKGQGGMPGFPASSLSDGDLANVIAYMRSLK